MAKTIKISDGDIDINDNGQASYIDGNRKAGQDVAACILVEFDPAKGFGSELATFELSNLQFVNSSVVQQLITDAIKRLQEKQRLESATTASEALEKIKILNIEMLTNGDVAFFLALETETGEEVSRALLVPTSLNHLLPDGVML